MEITTTPKGTHYFLSNNKLFLMRNDNGAFTNKWMGIWDGENKLIDSYSYKIRIDDNEQDPYNHCEKMIYRAFESVHAYKIPGIIMQENTYLPQRKKVIVSVLTFKNTSPVKKVITINFVMNANHRNYGENWHDTQYKTIFEAFNSHVQVSSEKGDVLYGTRKQKNVVINFYPLSTYNEYDSEGNKQKNFTPGAYTVQFEINPRQTIEIPFFIAASKTGLKGTLVSFVDLQKNYAKERQELEKEQKNVLKKYSVKLEKGLEELTYWSHHTMNLLKHENALFAGLPWFTQYWARDTFWSYKGLLCAGDFEHAYKILNFFADKKGIPNQIKINKEKNYDSLDATTMYVNALINYVNYTGDVQFIKNNRELISTIDKWFDENHDNGYLKEANEKDKTWMDTLKRERGIEIQALYAQSCKNMALLLKMLKSEKAEQYEKKYEEIKQKIHDYWIGEYYKDTETSKSLTPNQLVPLILNLIPKENEKKIIDKMILPEMLCEKGLRTLSKNDSEYFAEAYHKGKVWGLTTNWLITALLKQNNLGKATEILEKTRNNLEEHALGCLSETFNPETLTPTDASCQLWSASLILSGIDEELFGIKPELTKKQVTLTPCTVNGKIERHNKKIGNVLMDVMIEGSEKKQKIRVYFNKKPEFKIKLEFKQKQPITLEINGEKNESYEFMPKLENEIKIVF
ncbi:MAG: hypothetical protein GON13_02330 [Nanoarchaeota archaeon]|nr:hypothetical protein [Nanoarchaeota archaeon]